MHRTKTQFGELYFMIQNLFDENLKELKGDKILMGRDRWRKIDPVIRKNICEGLCGWLKERKHPLFISCLDTKRYHDTKKGLPKTLQRDIWVAGMMHIALQLQKKYKTAKNNKGKTVMLIDDNKRHADHLAILLADPPEWTNDYYGFIKKKKSQPMDQIVDTPFAVQSHLVGLVQVADLFAMIYRRHIEIADYGRSEDWKGEQPFLNRLVKSLNSCRVPNSIAWPKMTQSKCSGWYNSLAPDSIR